MNKKVNKLINKMCKFMDNFAWELTVFLKHLSQTQKTGYLFNKCQQIGLYYALHAAFGPPLRYSQNVTSKAVWKTKLNYGAFCNWI